MVPSPHLLSLILRDYQLDPLGIHGLSHWARVHEFGLKLATQTGADPTVVALFAVFHDSRRLNDGRDPEHGQRGAFLAYDLRGRAFNVSDCQFSLLCRACEGHTRGTPEIESDITVLTCWDADRLDLARVGKSLDPKRLCTASARQPEMLEWANSLSEEGHNPAVLEQWLRVIPLS